jgi:hypothetical protein
MNVHVSNHALADDGFAHDGRVRMAVATGRSKRPLPWSLLLLGAGYFMLVAGPLWASPPSLLAWLRASVSGAAWLPAPAAGGLALLGAAALIFVVARLVRDVEERPYGSIAPVLAVFSGFVLSSVRPELSLPGVTAQQLAVLVLVLALLGGALLQRAGAGERALGVLLALLPSLALLFALTAVHGARDPIALLQQGAPGLRTYLSLLSISALALAGVGASAQRLTRAPSQRAGLDAYGEPLLRLPRPSEPAHACTPEAGLRSMRAQPMPTYVERAVPPPLRRTSATRPKTPSSASDATTAARCSAIASAELEAVFLQHCLRQHRQDRTRRRERRSEQRELSRVGEHCGVVVRREGPRESRRERLAQQAQVVVDIVVARLGGG